MADGADTVTIRIASSILDVPAADWDACAGDANPFVSHAFLASLEESGSASKRSGWQAQHLLLELAGGVVAGVVPCYLKSHSYGEYVFDHGWAQAYERAGGRYYPKLQVAVPFTPATGPRVLVRPGPEANRHRRALIAGLVELAGRQRVSSLHVTFTTEAECADLRAADFLVRIGQQFHWRNQGYRTFDDFLAALNSRKRKAIRKERRAVEESGVRLKALVGPEIERQHWDAFYRFYSDTTDRKWGHAYLTRDFFHRLGETLADRVVLVVAEDRGEMVAGALNLLGAEALYGRNWGAVGHYKFLHFEACYYQAIEFAIRHGLQRVEAGAQGQHKIQRGYMPTPTYSAHWIREAGFRKAVARFLDEEREAVAEHMEDLSEARSPFREEGEEAG